MIIHSYELSKVWGKNFQLSNAKLHHVSTAYTMPKQLEQALFSHFPRAHVVSPLLPSLAIQLLWADTPTNQPVGAANTVKSCLPTTNFIAGPRPGLLEVFGVRNLVCECSAIEQGVVKIISQYTQCPPGPELLCATCNNHSCSCKLPSTTANLNANPRPAPLEVFGVRKLVCED